MSRTVIPPAHKLMILSSRPPRLRSGLGTNRDSKVLYRSRGTSSGTCPTSVCTVLGVLPLRLFGDPGRPDHRPRNPDARSSPRPAAPAPP